MNKCRNIAALVLALLMCLSLAACGDGDSGGNDDDISGGTPDTFEGMVKDPAYMADKGMYSGDWVYPDHRELEIEPSDDGQELRFTIYSSDEFISASGFIQTSPEYNADYFYNECDGYAYHCWFADDGTLNVYELGEFVRDDSDDDVDENVKKLAGVWYLDGDENSMNYLQIGRDGKWQLYEDNDGEPALVDRGISIRYIDENAFSAVSVLTDDLEWNAIAVRYDISLADDNTLYWGDEYDCYMRPD